MEHGAAHRVLAQLSDDKDRCRTFSEVIVTEGSHQYVIGTRLSVDNGKITAIDSLVSDKGDWLFNANAYLKYSSKEDWSAPKTGKGATMLEPHQRGQQLPRPVLRQVREDPVGQAVRAARRRRRTPIAKATTRMRRCEIGIPPGVLYIVNRDYVVDEEQGVINIFCRFGNSTTGHAGLAHLPARRTARSPTFTRSA